MWYIKHVEPSNEEVRIMGTVYAEITMKNAGDKIRVECGLLRGPEIRETTMRVVVDTGAETLIINEAVQKELGLTVTGLREAAVADGEEKMCKRTEPVEVHWKDRSMTCEAWVLPGAPEVLLGAIPLEDMDLIVCPKKRELVGAHGDKPVGRIY
jgi:clan AA aspartic protease